MDGWVGGWLSEGGREWVDGRVSEGWSGWVSE